MNRYLIVGLGNPGLRYRHTRHNMGFMAIDYLSEKHSVRVKRHRCRALTGECVVEDIKIILAKPQTYMNASGESIRELLEYYKLTIDNLIVIYDDMDVELGKIRIRKKGGAGTHNGMKSILYQIRSEDFLRIRIGISANNEKKTIRYVLSRFNRNQKKSAFKGIETAAKAIEEILWAGIDSAMNKYNG